MHPGDYAEQEQTTANSTDSGLSKIAVIWAKDLSVVSNAADTVKQHPLKAHVSMPGTARLSRTTTAGGSMLRGRLPCGC